MGWDRFLPHAGQALDLFGRQLVGVERGADAAHRQRVVLVGCVVLDEGERVVAIGRWARGIRQLLFGRGKLGRIERYVGGGRLT